VAVVIRLSRSGKKNSAIFRLVTQDKERHPTKKILEKLGTYFPLSQQKPGTSKLVFNKERLDFWISKGAVCSPRVSSLLKMAQNGTLDNPKTSKPKKSKKAQAAANKPAETNAEAKPAEETKAEAPKTDEPQAKTETPEPKPE
jgi:small subunit ribosomal protein S16